MRALVASDLHYTLRQLDWVTAHAGEYDLVCLAGDLLDITSIVDPDAQVAVVLEYLDRIAARTQLLVCSGNHDLDGVNEFDERAARWLESATVSGVVVDGDHLELPGFLVTVCAYWDGPRSRELVGAQLAADAARVDGRRWIWAYHAPPDRSPTSWTGKRHYGDEALNEWITQHSPDVVLCGHVHHSPFAQPGGWRDRIGSTVVFNAGNQIGPEPTHIVIDTDTGIASWSSYEGIDDYELVGISTPDPGRAPT